MGNEGRVWVMRGLAPDDPCRIRTWRDLVGFVDEAGFLPLFANGIPGFSVEEHTASQDWWTGDPERDPWKWREVMARSGEVAYGKFFGGKSGFIRMKQRGEKGRWSRGAENRKVKLPAPRTADQWRYG